VNTDQQLNSQNKFWLVEKLNSGSGYVIPIVVQQTKKIKSRYFKSSRF
jgi:predicted secreted protein